MTEVLLNEELSFTYPDGFRVLEAAEVSRLFSANGLERWAIWDEDRRAIFCLQWRTVRGIAAALVHPKNHVRRVVMRARASYRGEECEASPLSACTVAGEPAYEASFTYSELGVRQRARVMAFKHSHKGSTTVYTLYFYTRESDVESNGAVLRSLLSTMHFA